MIDANNNLTGKFICDLLLDNLNCNGSVREEWHVDLPEGSTVAPPKVSCTIKDVYILENDRSNFFSQIGETYF